MTTVDAIKSVLLVSNTNCLPINFSIKIIVVFSSTRLQVHRKRQKIITNKEVYFDFREIACHHFTQKPANALFHPPLLSRSQVLLCGYIRPQIEGFLMSICTALTHRVSKVGPQHKQHWRQDQEPHGQSSDWR